MSEFETALQEHYAPLQRYINFKIGNRHDAEDVLQDVCLTAMQKFETLSNRDAFKAWLLAIARNKINDYYRKKSAHPQISLDALPRRLLSWAEPASRFEMSYATR